jgi:HK97 gp10 family phage protein
MARVTRVVSRNVFESIAQMMTDRTAAATAVVHREMVKKISKSGPPASAPGEPPRVDTARLRQSLQPSVVREGNTIRGTVSTNVEYAEHLEYGTSKMAARPFMRSTVAEQVEPVKAIMRGRR